MPLETGTHYMSENTIMVDGPAQGEPSVFAGLGLSKPVLKAVDDLGYTTPSPVQLNAIPHVLQGRDLLAAAQTGTGKTAAFLLPCMSTLPHGKGHHGPFMLVVTPTRELAQQIEKACTTIANRTGHSSFTVVGGVGYERQKAALKRGIDILVATPGRLVDLIDQGVANLSEVSTLVLDEADRMLDMGFLPDMRKIVAQIPGERQTLLFSATLDEKAIGNIRDLVQDPAIVEIAHKGTVAETIDQFVLPMSPEVKNDMLAQVLKAEGTERVIVFCRTKRRADTCCKRLHRADISCAPIHGDRSQKQRERALASFRKGKCDVLVATDVLARGIDVSDVRYVVNFDVPVDAEDYIHRIGRTGRAGEAGWALTFVTPDDYADLRSCERLMKLAVPTYERAEEFDLGERPPVLDPDRSVDGPEKPGRKRKRSGRRKPAQDGEARNKRAGRPARPKHERAEGNPKAEASVATTEATPSAAERSEKPARTRSGKPAGEKRSRNKGERSDRSSKPARSAKPERTHAEEPGGFELLTEKEVGAINRTAGRGRGKAGKAEGGRGEGMDARRKRNSRRGTGAQGRGDTPAREPRKPASSKGSRGGKAGEARRDAGRNEYRGGRGAGEGRGYRGGNGRAKTPAGKSGRRVGDQRGRSRGVH